MRTLFTFHGGVHPPEHKRESSERAIARLPLPKLLALPLQQHLGAAAKSLVQAGDPVLKGQLIARAEGTVSVALHAPTSGKVLAVEARAVPHASGLSDSCIVIETDGEERWVEHTGFDYQALTRQELLNRLRDGGIVGLGGATFPAHIKLAAQNIQTLVINGAECEPWITTDDRLMRERAAEVVQGIDVLRHLLQPGEIVIGIEDNKPEAIAAMQQACAGQGVEVAVIPTLYPSGGEKQLIKILTGKEVPSSGRPFDIGVVCSNVATAYTIARLVHHGEPMVSRIVTITGSVQTPQNIEVPLGTPIAELERFAGKQAGGEGYIMGGPMMGLHVLDDTLPVVKATNCIIVKSAQLFPPQPPALPCIRCTRCAQACPAELQPQELYWFSKAKNFDKAEAYHLFDCIECGACAYVCPSNIPLVQYYRFAKSEIAERKREHAAADAARQRHEFRLERIERDKREKAEKLAQKEKANAEARAAAQPADEQALIQAALARAQQQAVSVTPQNTDHLTPAQQAQVDEAEARRTELHQITEHAKE